MPPRPSRGQDVFGAQEAGVSMRISGPDCHQARSQTRARVVCTLGAIETFSPTSALTSVDFPALGAPMTATKPHGCRRGRRLCHGIFSLCQRGFARRVFSHARGTLRRNGRKPFNQHLHFKNGGMVRAGTLHNVVHAQTTALRPFLQRRFASIGGEESV